MGHDIYCFIERRVGDEWLVCREDGSIFDKMLTSAAYKEAEASGRASWQYNDVLDEIKDVCGFDIPRSFDDITPLFKPDDVSDSFMSLICAEYEIPYYYALKFNDLLLYRYNLTVATSIQDKQHHREKLFRLDTIFTTLIERMSKVDANPKDIRVIMRYE